MSELETSPGVSLIFLYLDGTSYANLDLREVTLGLPCRAFS